MIRVPSVATSPRLLLSAATLAVALCATAPVWAQSEPDQALATELFNAGRDLLKERKYEEACPKLDESARLDPQVGTFARLAECREKLGELSEARRSWQRAQNLAKAKGDDRLELIERELKRLDAMVPKLELRFSAPPPEQLSMRIGDLVMSDTAAGLPFPMDPGSQTLIVSAPGHVTRRVELEIPPGGGTTVVQVPVLEREKVAVVAPPPRDTTQQTAAYVAGGVGATFLVAGAVLGIVTLQQKGMANDNCNDDTMTCNSEGVSANDTGAVIGPLSTLGFVLGAAGLATAAVLLWTDEDEQVAVSMPVGVGTSGAELAVKARW